MLPKQAPVIESLKKLQKISKSPIFYNSQITKYGRSGDIKAAELLFDRMPFKDTVSWTAMLTAYADNKQIDKARVLFDEMPKRSIASYNAMIAAYVNNGLKVNEGFMVFNGMTERNSVTYATMISGFSRAGMLDKAEKLYLQMPENWRDPVCSNVLLCGYLKARRLDDAVRVFETMLVKNVVSLSCMVDGYCKNGKVAEARRLFDEMEERNVVSWTAMINGYMKCGYFEDGFQLFVDMRQEGTMEINCNALTVMFEACGKSYRFKEGIQLHKLFFCLGFDFDVFLGNSLINMYCSFGCMNEARRVFDTMTIKDIVSWNSLLGGYAQNGEMAEAYRFFENIKKKDVVTWTSMISGFFNQGMIEKSMQLLEMMPFKDDVAWTAAISGLVDNKQYQEAICQFIQMLRKGVSPNPLTLSSVVSASAGCAVLHQGVQIHAYIEKVGKELDLSIQNSLNSMYSKCGNVTDAYQIFINIVEPNIVSFNSMITGFSQNGFGEEALRLFENMQNKGQEPNQVTFLAVLSACVHMGLVEVGWKFFKSMRFTYNIEPGPDHYACMVDLLGRAGLLDEAIKLIDSMPFEPHAGAWGALLSASKSHSRLDIAKLASQNLFKLDPNDAAPYIGLSNVYSVSGEQQSGALLRRMKNLKGLKKIPGSSWIMK